MSINKEKYLIVNADDFGIDEEINKGIAECFRSGIVTSTSIVANGSAIEDALNLVKKNKNIGVGVHLCLVGEKSTLPREKIPSIVDDNNIFFKNYRHFFFNLCGNKINLSDVKMELKAQIKIILDNGIVPTHLDSHQYLHLIPSIFNIVMGLAKEYKIKWIRYPRQNNAQFIFTNNFFKKICLEFFCGYQFRAMKNNCIHYPNLSYNFMSRSNLNEYVLRKILSGLAIGFTDITCHPGYIPKNRRYIPWKYKWEKETGALKNEDIKLLIKELNIKLVNYDM